MINHHRFSAAQFSFSFSQFDIIGTDAFAFLQAQITFDLRLLAQNTFHLISLLDRQGKIECYGWLLNAGTHFILLAPLALNQVTEARLNRFLISEEVSVNKVPTNSWHLLLGLDAPNYVGSENFQGEMFGDQAVFAQISFSSSVPVLSTDELQLWRGLSGWPSLDGKDFLAELVNNSRLYDLSVSPNKGCYPGQETVSKIATHRGAAYSPVLLETDQLTRPGILTTAGNKIGNVTECFFWNNRHYLAASVLRDFRVEGMELHCEINQQSIQSIVRYYPLLAGSRELKAMELYYLAGDYFKHDQLDKAEATYQLSIKLNPTYADSYESLGVMLGRQERFDEAIELMKQLSQVDPDSVLAHTNLSLFLMRLGRIEEAEEQKSQATLKSFKKFGQEAREKESKQVATQKQLDEWEQREGMFRQVLEIDPEDTLANYGLGSIAVEKKSWLEARTYLEKVIAVDAKYSVAYLALGRAYAALGLKTEAKTTFISGIKIAAAKGDMMPANQMQSEMEKIKF